MAETHPYQHFVELLQSFVTGRNRSEAHVAAMECEFSRHFDDDPRFLDLQYELAMFGADDHPAAESLVKECEYVLEVLQSAMKQGDSRE